MNFTFFLAVFANFFEKSYNDFVSFLDFPEACLQSGVWATVGDALALGINADKFALKTKNNLSPFIESVIQISFD